MSFGFSVGDFLAVLQLANTVRQKWEDAPGEYAAIKDETKTVSNILQNLGELSKRAELNPEQKLQVQNACDSCYPVLQKCELLAEKCPSEEGATGGRARFKKAWKRLQLDPDDVRKLRQQLISCVNILNALLTIVQSIEIFEIRKGVDDIRSHEARLQNKPIADWFSIDNSGKHQDDLLSLRHRGTGLWLLKDPKYNQWLEGTGGTLLCPGIPGSGKSIMSATIISDLRARFESKTDVVVTYYYCSFQRQTEQTARNVLAALVRQLFQQQTKVPREVQELYDKYQPRQETPNVEDLSKLMLTLTKNYTKVFFLIDALDEWMDGESSWTEFLNEIFALQKQEKINLNILATTRFIPDIIDRFALCPHIEIRAHQDDIEHYLEHNISRLSVKPHIKLKAGDATVTVGDAVKSQIAAAADGMFLLARLQLESLIDKTTPRKLQLALTQLRKGSEALNTEYEKALVRIDQQREGFRQLAQKILACVVHARRELSIGELQEAVAIEEDMEDIDHTIDLEEEQQLASVCAGLVRVDHEANVIRLVHYTTQEYLELVSCDRLGGERIIARSCLQYLSMDVFKTVSVSGSQTMVDLFEKYRFLRYAGENWHHHANSNIEEEYVLKTDELFTNPKQLKFLGNIMLGGVSSLSPDVFLCRTLSQLSSAHIYAHLGLLRMVSHVIDRGEAIDERNSADETPLFLAAKNGHSSVVRLLLGQPGVDVNSISEGCHFPLSCAAQEGHLEVVKAILQRTDLVTIFPSGEYYESPLTLAATGGHLDVVKLLFARAELKADAKIFKYWTPLLGAIQNGHLEVVKFLISDQETSINGNADTAVETPLSGAAAHGREEILELLLARPDIEISKTTAGSEMTALDFAIVNGHAKIVRTLLSRAEFAPLYKECGIETKILLAAEGGSLEVVQAFFDSSNTNLPTPNPDFKNQHGQTALSLAASSLFDESSRIIKFLLERAQSNPNTRDVEGMTPLFHAVNQDRPENVAVLLENAEVDVNVRDISGQTPLGQACSKGYPSIVTLLLKHPRISINAKDNTGRTALSWAAEHGMSNIIQLLFTHPEIDIEIADEHGRAPVVWAAKEGEADSARLLLEYLHKSRDPNQSPPSYLQEVLEDLRRFHGNRSWVSGLGGYAFNNFGRCFLYLGDADSALAAYRSFMKTGTESLQALHDGIECDGCQQSPILGARFVCMTCPWIDLCLACREKHRTDLHIASCVKHEFLEVPGEGYVRMIAEDSD